MAAKIEGQASLAGLQHAEQNTIIAFITSQAAGFKKGTFTLMGYMKTTVVVTGVTLPALSVAYKISGTGAGAVSGTDVFVVPGPEVGTGISFAIVAALVGLFTFYKAKRLRSV